MTKVASIDHNVERGDREPRDNECVPESKVTADTAPQTDIRPRARHVLLWAHPARISTHCQGITVWLLFHQPRLPSFPFCLVRSNYLSGRLRVSSFCVAMYKKTSHIE
jgi:hypothetical protein